MVRPGTRWAKSLRELLTIIAGVLIALAADDWRESVRDREDAEQYSARLHASLAADIEELTRAAAAAAQVDSAATRVLAVVRGQDVSETESRDFMLTVLRASVMPPPAVSRDTYDDLVTTGNMRLLPVEARETLGAYYSLVQVYSEREDIFRERLSRGYWTVPPRVLGPDLLPPVWQALATPEPPISDELTVSKTQLGEMVRRLRAIPEMETWLADVRHVMVQRRSNYADRLRDQAREAQAALDSAR